jgi:hypothetical protein
MDYKKYVYILGFYLGNGWIYKPDNKESYQLNIAINSNYTDLIESVYDALLIFNRKVTIYHRKDCKCVNVKVTITDYIHLFPQYGIGLKHHRSIVLNNFQKFLVNKYCITFIKGLIYSDGSICYTYTNPKYKDKLYKTITFSNKSKDIFELLLSSLDKVGIHKQLPNITKEGIYKISIRSKQDIDLLEFLKPKT